MLNFGRVYNGFPHGSSIGQLEYTKADEVSHHIIEVNLGGVGDVLGNWWLQRFALRFLFIYQSISLSSGWTTCILMYFWSYELEDFSWSNTTPAPSFPATHWCLENVFSHPSSILIVCRWLIQHWSAGNTTATATGPRLRWEPELEWFVGNEYCVYNIKWYITY